MNNPYDLAEDLEVTLEDEIDYTMNRSSSPYDPVTLQEDEEILSRLLERSWQREITE